MLKRVFSCLDGRSSMQPTRSGALVASAVALLSMAMAGTTSAQTAPATAAAAVTAAPATASPVLSAPTWGALSTQQQQALQPLAESWDALAEGRKRKWLALSQTYTQLPAPEQAKMHARMAEWAALKPKEREQARLNFAETKKIAPADRAANWEAYQALTAEEKRDLAEKARKKPASAAIAVKPVAPEKLALVSVTRRTPEPAPEKQQILHAIDRHTLLPVSRQPDANTIESPLTQGPHRQ